jgi:hypothetical protein
VNLEQDCRFRRGRVVTPWRPDLLHLVE